jgi:AAA+ ATPase superfamily predicted ATPase
MGNLFDNPTTLRDPDLFVGRESELERIFGMIRNRQSVSLVGLRRIGKTSLLMCLQSTRIQQKCHFDGSRFLFLYLDLQTRSMEEQVDFIDDVHRILTEGAQAQGYALASAEGLSKDDEIRLLLAAFAKDRWFPVLIMDTFDEVNQYRQIPENVFRFLRSLATAGYISYITASVKTIGEIFRKLVPVDSEPSPLYNIFATVKLRDFAPHEARMHLMKTSTKSGLPFSEEEMNWIVGLAGRHPFLLQQVATLLFEEKQAQGSKEVDYQHIQKEAQRNVFSYFEDCWMMLSNSDHQEIIAGVLQFEKDGKQHRSYPELCFSALFSEYLRSTEKMVEAFLPLHLPHKNASDITAKDYKAILDALNDPVALGESKLIGIPLIRTRIEQQQANLPTVRGKIVGEVLREALERMAGQGERSDVDQAWRYYNILYYRYFMRRHSMNQEMIANKLAFSERQYYRFVRKALDQFRNEVQALDATHLSGATALKSGS